MATIEDEKCTLSSLHTSCLLASVLSHLTAVILDIVNLLFTVLLGDKILIMGLRETSCLLVTLYFHFYLLVRLRHYKLLG